MNNLGPLGLLPNIKMRADQRELLQWVEDYDFTSMKYSYIAEHPENSPQVRLIARELKRFLTLPLLVKKPTYGTFAPSGIVDGMWHCFILHTRLYREFCEKVAGGYIDHNPPPAGGRKEGLAIFSGEIFANTKEELTTHYGALPVFAWGASARCDTAAPCVSWPSPTI